LNRIDALSGTDTEAYVELRLYTCGLLGKVELLFSELDEVI
jgi:hypothetical protein